MPRDSIPPDLDAGFILGSRVGGLSRNNRVASSSSSNSGGVDIGGRPRRNEGSGTGNSSHRSNMNKYSYQGNQSNSQLGRSDKSLRKRDAGSGGGSKSSGASQGTYGNRERPNLRHSGSGRSIITDSITGRDHQDSTARSSTRLYHSHSRYNASSLSAASSTRPDSEARQSSASRSYGISSSSQPQQLSSRQNEPNVQHHRHIQQLQRQEQQIREMRQQQRQERQRRGSRTDSADSTNVRTHWTCVECTYVNTSSARRCQMCSNPSPLGSSIAAPAGRDKQNSSAVLSAAFQQQFMRDLNINFSTKIERPGRRRLRPREDLTLAQKMDLAPKPAPKLTTEEWEKVHAKAMDRDMSEECPICCEEFRDQDQVLLSCTHVFHKVCLANFERFSGQRSCPICRTKEYEKRKIDDGRIAYERSCAVKIQALWRGYVVRKAYEKMKLHIPPKDPAKRKEFYYNKLMNAGKQLQQVMEHKDNAIDALFAEFDRNVQNARTTLEFASMQMRTIEDYEWEVIKQRADLRADVECPICMMAFGAGKHQVLLSCSHVFHDSCLYSFEKFTVNQLQTENGMSAAGCPMCRSPYQKIGYEGPHLHHDEDHADGYGHEQDLQNAYDPSQEYYLD